MFGHGKRWDLKALHHFTVEETEAQKCWLAGPRSNTWFIEEFWSPGSNYHPLLSCLVVRTMGASCRWIHPWGICRVRRHWDQDWALTDTVGCRGRETHKADWGWEGREWSRNRNGRNTWGQGKKLLLKESNGQPSQISQIRSDQISRSVVSNSLRPPPCASPTPGVHSDSHPSSQWCHPKKESKCLFHLTVRRLVTFARTASME